MTHPSQDPSPSRGPIHWMAGHSVAANLLMVVLLIGGLIYSAQVKKEVFPDFDLDIITVSVPYPGASPEEVERSILLAVEEAVSGLEGVDKVTSQAREGFGTVSVEMLEGSDRQRLAQEVRAEVDRIASFPADAEDPLVTIVAHKRGVVSLVLYGDQDERTLRAYAEYIRDLLLQSEAITQIELAAVRDYEIAIEIPQSTLRNYDLTLDEVARRIRSASVDLPGGAIKAASGDVLLRMKEQRDTGRELGRIPVITADDGTQVLLEDMALIKDGFVETDYSTTYNGQPAVLIEVYRVGDQTPITVSNAVRQVVADLKQTLPAGLSVDLRNDRSENYRQRLGLLMKNGFMGLGLVFLLLALFLEPRLAFWVSLGIPISFLGSFYLLPVGDVSINMISMFAFIVTLGIVVDDAIVVGENIYNERRKGSPWFTAAVKGAQDIAVPVIFSVLTNMVAFVPMLFVPGAMGKIFRLVPVVVISVFSISLIESLLILPAHLGHQKQRRTWGPLNALAMAQQRFSNAFIRNVRTKYGPLLALVLRWRYVSMGIGVAILLISIGYIRSGRLGFELFPKIESDFARVTATLPFGSAFQKTAVVERRLVEAAKAVVAENGGDMLSEGIYANISNNVTEVRVYLTLPKQRPLSTGELTELWRKRVGSIPGLEALKFESDAGGPGRGDAISVELSHTDVGVLEKASAELAAAFHFYPEIVDVDDGFSPGKQQIDFQVRPEARSLGLTADTIARQLRYAYYGAEALRQQRGRSEVRVMVRLPKSERISEYYLEQMLLRTPSGGELPLKNAVVLERGRAYTDIDRRDGRRVVTVSADARPRSKAGQVLADLTQG
ncbi:MAG: efflux RND transporter permease subunit, partial [Desulfatitalea sp.]|nr:efflux RND transporter permease subunit [Desulfatitalea sp.]NNK00561.1 efflux RND transporter permease subunit [Desulfatitalea sp.]